jgi:hypothetical protein
VNAAFQVVFRRTFAVAVALVLAHAILPQEAVAGTARGRVISIYMINPTAPSTAGASVLGFTLETATAGAPACSDGSWAIDLGSPVGRAMHQQLMHAAEFGRVVYVQGDDTCGVWNVGRERVLSIQVNYYEYLDPRARGNQ